MRAVLEHAVSSPTLGNARYYESIRICVAFMPPAGRSICVSPQPHTQMPAILFRMSFENDLIKLTGRSIGQTATLV